MRTLLDDLRHTSTPLRVISRDRLAAYVKAAHVALLNAAVTQVRDESTSGWVRELRRYALWLESAALDGEELTGEERDSALNLASNLLEMAGRLSDSPESVNLFRPPLNDLLRSAVIGSLTGYQAQCTVIGRRVSEALASLEELDEVASIHRLCGMVIASFVGRDYHRATSLAEDLLPLSSRVAHQLSQLPQGEVVALDLACSLALNCQIASVGMLVGRPALVGEAIRKFQSDSARSQETEEPNLHWLAKRLHATAQHMLACSAQRVLSEHHVASEFVRALIRDGFYELWEPQLDGIAKGVADPSSRANFVVAIPTGAGKTLIAQLSLMAALGANENNWAMYICPSRALVTQVSSDLRRGLSSVHIDVRTVLGDEELAGLASDEMESLSARKTVTVTTPEKLDAYYRNNPALFVNCTMVIFDEAHKISESGRGALLESLISRLLIRRPRVRLMLLSGVLSNHRDLISWLGEDRTELIAAKRRPTRQIRGLAVRYDETIGPIRQLSGGPTQRKDFLGGLLLVHEAEDLEAIDLRPQLLGLFRGHVEEQLTRRGSWREVGGSTNLSHGVQLAEALSAGAGTTIIFVAQPAWAESACAQFTRELEVQFHDERARLAEFVAGELGPEHALAGYCRRGVAFHHARLPSVVQRAVEMGLERGWLKVVFATSTLREGMNTPATNVVLVGSGYWDDTIKKRVPIANADFENIAGRAGRPHFDTEGCVVLVPDSLAVARTIEAGREYLLVGDEALRARSQLSALATAIESSNGAMLSLPGSDQSLLLALRVAGLDDVEDVEEFFEKTLWAVQEDDLDRPRRVASNVVGMLDRAEEELGHDRLLAAARTGLSLTSAEMIRERLLQHLDVLDMADEDPLTSALPILVEACLLAPEMIERLRNANRPSNHVAPLRAWIRGRSYAEILRIAIEERALRESADVGECVRYCSDLSNWLSWGVGSCCLILSSITEQALGERLSILPLLIRYGVSTKEAAYLSLLGVGDRSSAERLAQLYRDSRRALSLESLSEWLSDIGGDVELLFDPEDLRPELLRRQLFGRRREPRPFATFTIESTARSLQLGERLHVRVGSTRADIISESGNVLATLPVRAALRRLARAGDGRLFAIVLSINESRNRVTIAAIIQSHRVPEFPASE